MKAWRWAGRVLCLALALLALTAGVASAAAPQAPFVGSWEAIDGDFDGDGIPEGPDGSYMRLVLARGGGDKFYFNYLDFGASCCGKDPYGEPLYAAQVMGWVTLVGENELDGQAPLYCLAHPRYEPPAISPLAVHYVYDPATDTLFDGWVTWRRMGTLSIGP